MPRLSQGILGVTLINLAAWGLLGLACAHADTIDSINQRVNHMVLRETIDIGTGPIQGGCRLYAEEKRRQLIASGMDPSRIELWVVSVPREGVLHEVLVLDGDRVLDNLDPWTETKRATGYVFLWIPQARDAR